MAPSPRRASGATVMYEVGDLTVGATAMPAASPTARSFAAVADPDAAGKPDRTFVLVHGLGMSSRYFRPLVAELLPFGSVVTVDLPGYGVSPKAGRPVLIEDHAEALTGYLKAAGIRRPVLVGHSMGAQVVSRAVFDHPEIAHTLVLLGPTVDPRGRSFPAQAARLGLDSLRETPQANWVVFTDYLFRSGIPYYVAQLRSFFSDHIEERLPMIQTRTLVIRGHRDPVVRREWIEEMAVLLPHGESAEVPGPHVIMYTAPRETAALIVNHAAGGTIGGTRRTDAAGVGAAGIGAVEDDSIGLASEPVT